MNSGVVAGGEHAPSVAVIITNWNYGHFLAGCIECLLAQTRGPDEIIVVDDGSSDGSIATLAEYADRVRVVRQANGGQASAFNTGFAHSTSSLVLFLDADDLLRPEAIETIVTWWRPDLSSLSFWLELIDVGGRSRGLYEETLRVDDGDKRQRLISRGVFAFAPTSGNVFSRGFLDRFLPLDEARWRISADLPLTYAAALHGPSLVIPQALGAYRTHGTNNYYRERLPDVWRLHRGMHDVVDALAFLAERQHGRGPSGGDDGLLELALRFASLRMRTKLQALDGNRGDLARHAKQHAQRVFTSTLPFRLRLIAAAFFAVTGYAGGWRWSHLRRWIADPRARPALAHVVMARLRRHRPNGILARYARLELPRWHAMLPAGLSLGPDFNGLAASIMAQGWSGEMSDTLHWSRGPAASLEFRLDPHPFGIRVELALMVCPALSGTTLAFETTIGNRRLTVDHLINHGVVAVDLSRDMLEANAQIRLEVACAIVAPRQSTWQSMIGPAPYFAIRSIRVRLLDLPPSFPLLVPGIAHRFGHILPAPDVLSEWEVDRDGAAWIAQSEAKCRITVAPFPYPVALTLVIAESEARGWLRITCGDLSLFSGTVVSGAELRCALPPVASPDDTGLDLVFTFSANDPTEVAKLGIATIGLVTLDEATAGGLPRSEQALHLNIGERIDLDLKAGQCFAVGTGWELDDDAGLRNVETEASFALAIPPGCLDPVLHLAVEPLLPEPEGHHHVLAISAEHEVLVSARLQGVGSLDVSIPPARAGVNRILRLTLHSIFIADSPAEQGSGLPLFAGVRLRAVSLSAHPPSASHALARPFAPTYAGSVLHDLADEAQRVVSGQCPHGRDGLRAVRGRLAIAIWRTDSRGLESHLMVPGFLDALEGLGALTAFLALDPGEVALVAEIKGCPSAPGVLLRQCLCSMVLRILPHCPGLTNLRNLPAPLLWSPHPLARYLALKPSGNCRGAVPEGTGPYSERLLEGVLAVLQHEPPASTSYQLAVGILKEFGPGLGRSLPDSSGAIQRLWARCVERHLSRSGCVLAASSLPRRRRSRLRTGLVIHDVHPSPDCGTLLGIGSALDSGRFEPVLITLARSSDGIDLSDTFPTVVDLSNETVETGAASIRGLDLDILLITAKLDRMDKLAAIVSHRLAPLQILLSGIIGWGSALRSIDTQWGSNAGQGLRLPANFLAHDGVRLPCLDAFAFAGKFLVSEAATGCDLEGTNAGPVVMAASAADLEDYWPLAELWIRILAACPESELVIAADPRTANGGPETAPIRGLIGMWCHDLNVAQSRVTLLEGVHGSDQGVLGAAGLYLGYLGNNADHILEALDRGVPFVALADPAGNAPSADAWAAVLYDAGLVATSSEAYIRSAVDLAGDAAARHATREAIGCTLSQPRDMNAQAADGINDMLMTVATDRGMVAEDTSR